MKLRAALLAVLLPCAAACGGARGEADAPAPAAASGEEQIPEDAAAKLMKACYAEGHAVACQALAVFFDEGVFGYRKDPEAAEKLRAFSWALLQHHCDEGDAQQCSLGGLMLGIGLEKMPEGDPRIPRLAAVVVPMLDRGCRGGEAGACGMLGSLHEQGRGVDRDAARAAALYGQGCEAGDDWCCTWVGNERWGAHDTAGAAAAYRKACDAGTAKERARRAEEAREAKGSKGPKDAKKAKNAGEAPSWAQSCTMAGYLHEQGEGVPRDLQRAIEMYRRACEGGDERGCSDARRLTAPNRMFLAPPRW